jgi:hypothetical protein
LYLRVVLTAIAVLLIVNVTMQFKRSTLAAAPAHELIMLKGNAKADYVTQRVGDRQVTRVYRA